MKGNYYGYKMILRILSVLLISILLSSCNVKEKKIEPGETNTTFINQTKKQKIIDLEKTENILPDIKSEFEILFFEDDTIILSSEKYNLKQVDCTDMLLYRYDLEKKETKFIHKIKNFYSSPGSMELVEGKL